MTESGLLTLKLIPPGYTVCPADGSFAIGLKVWSLVKHDAWMTMQKALGLLFGMLVASNRREKCFLARLATMHFSHEWSHKHWYKDRDEHWIRDKQLSLYYQSTINSLLTLLCVNKLSAGSIIRPVCAPLYCHLTLGFNSTQHLANVYEQDDNEIRDEAHEQNLNASKMRDEN